MFDDPVPLGRRPDRPPLASGRLAVLVGLALAAVAFYQASYGMYGKAASAPDRGIRHHTRSLQSQYSTARQGIRLTPADVRDYASASLYDPQTLRTIFLEFEHANWEEELAARYRTGTDLPARVTIDGTTYRDVAVRFRGNSSYRMVPSGLKRSLNLSFDAVRDEQSVGGYRTLNLLNANGDPTFVRTVLYSEIARKYLPAPRVNFVRVVINAENWGIYLNVQQFNKDFLRDFYGTTTGVRWKVPGSPRGRAGLEYLGDSVESYRGLYEIKSKDQPEAWADLIRLCRLLNTTPSDELQTVLAPHLDIDGALKFLALEVALVNTDGYWTRASDYSLFQDDKGRFHVLPYDFNEAIGVRGFGRRGGAGAGPTLDPLVGLDDVSKPLRSKLLAAPALRTRYLAYVREIAEDWMDWKTVEPLVQRYQALIEADVRMDGRKLYEFAGFDPAGLRRFFTERRAFLLQPPTGES